MLILNLDVIFDHRWTYRVEKEKKQLERLSKMKDSLDDLMLKHEKV